MNGQLAASSMEQETVAERIRLEAREAGRKEGERDGRVEGMREAMLELVKELAPDRIREFEAIADPHVLRRAALALVRQSSGAAAGVTMRAPPVDAVGCLSELLKDRDVAEAIVLHGGVAAGAGERPSNECLRRNGCDVFGIAVHRRNRPMRRRTPNHKPKSRVR